MATKKLWEMTEEEKKENEENDMLMCLDGHFDKNGNRFHEVVKIDNKGMIANMHYNYASWKK